VGTFVSDGTRKWGIDEPVEIVALSTVSVMTRPVFILF